MGSRVRRWFYGLIMAGMVFTGFGQMPVFKRYYISSLPGMGWSADFYITLLVHYVGASLLLGFLAYVVTDYLFVGRKALRITAAGFVRMILLAALITTGIFRVLKNLPDIVFSPGFTMVVDISHLGFMMAYGAVGLLFWRMKARWVSEKQSERRE
ncbi:MAG: FeS-binding protein [Deltaproteobacteria bacterium]|nr:FeS-binding protein [Deltaproteobacteria bacterium]